MSSRSIFGKKFDSVITSEDILGKNVIDSEGSIVGVAEKVFIDKKTLDFIGVSVDKGLFKKGVVIGKDYLDRIEEHALFLKTSIMFELKGLKVFDKNGKEVGKIKEVKLIGSRNSIKEIIVASGLLRAISISPGHISTIGENVILNVTKEELEATKHSKE